MREVIASCDAWAGPRLVKVEDAVSFAQRGRDPTRSILDVRSAVLDLGVIGHLPWAGLLVANDFSNDRLSNSRLVVSTNADIRVGDVLEVVPGRKRIQVVYRPQEVGNVLFATERCNNFCLMCSQPPREVEDRYRVELMHELIDLVDPDEPTMGLSGGEPTLLGTLLVDVIRHCALVLPHTHLHVLTNGRRFSEVGFAAQFHGVHPDLMWGIPLYGDTFHLHDYVVQAPGAFADTVRGLYALQAAGQRVEIRVVLVRPTVERLPAIARFIQRNFPFVEHVALMGTEPIGFAKANHEALWVDPEDAVPALLDAVEALAGHGISVSLYNQPLCVLPRPLWRYARTSISEWKRDYLPACEGCAARSRCGGFFKWLTPEWTSRAIAPLSEGGFHA